MKHDGGPMNLKWRKSRRSTDNGVCIEVAVVEESA
jgi:hypothetical protein